ncbi:hypothetical protein MW290_21035 [Aquincola tertiaricarbonis]|uniref:Transposase n=1 Tax=Aquincola tertiaricarbonis TaxID=391953 RepID=A0ABY4SDN4_AQUTE|nr:hypothetical protein [Aquincola tertiaricarbonis]URI11431.1 hypothetical protein MW290_21035 [Aquincola tertiaricarbonis]
MNPARCIKAEHVLLALVARRANPSCRWAAMADHHWTARECWRRDLGPTTVHARPPALTPMQRGSLHRAIRRQYLVEGLRGIRKTFGTTLRAVVAEPAHVVPDGRMAATGER